MYRTSTDTAPRLHDERDDPDELTRCERCGASGFVDEDGICFSPDCLAARCDDAELLYREDR